MKTHLRVLTLLAAINAAPHAMAAPKVAPTNATKNIDPKALALLNRTRAKYRAMKSISWDGEQKIKTSANTTAVTKSSFYFLRPSYLLSMQKMQGGEIKVVADAKSIFISSREGQDKKWQSRPLSHVEQTDSILKTMNFAGGVSPFLSGNELYLKEDRSLRLSTQPGVWRGMAGDNLTIITTSEAVLSDAEGKADLMQNFFIGKKDGLIHRATFRMAVKNRQIMVEEIYSNIKVNPVLPKSLFKFVPPLGAKEIKQEDTEIYWDKNLKEGTAPPDFEAQDLDGKTIRLSDYKGKVVLLDFWATWCGPCVAEVPNVRGVYEKYHAQGFEIIGVSFDQSRNDLQKFIAKEKMPWPQIFDGKGFESAVNANYKVRGIPFMLLVGRDGKIAVVNPRGEALEKAVKKALAQTP